MTQTPACTALLCTACPACSPRGLVAPLRCSPAGACLNPKPPPSPSPLQDKVSKPQTMSPFLEQFYKAN